MLAKKYRFKNFDFEKFRNSKKIQNSLFLIRKIDSENEEKKFAVTTNNKEFKKAVLRNKIRRKIFEIIRLNLEKIHPGYYLINVRNKEALKMNFKEIEKILLQLFSRLNA